MNKAIVLVLSLFIQFSDAAADYFLPDGCYVTLSNPYYCYEIPAGGILSWTTSTDQSFLASHYGRTMAIVLSRHYELQAALANTQVALANVQNDSAQCSAEFNTCIDDYNGLVSPFNHQLILIKKLRKKCGRACKNIR